MLIYYCHKVKHIFYTIPIFEVMTNNLSFGFYSRFTLVFWLPNLTVVNETKRTYRLVSFTTVHEREA